MNLEADRTEPYHTLKQKPELLEEGGTGLRALQEQLDVVVSSDGGEAARVPDL